MFAQVERTPGLVNFGPVYIKYHVQCKKFNRRMSVVQSFIMYTVYIPYFVILKRVTFFVQSGTYWRYFHKSLKALRPISQNARINPISS